MKHITLLSFLLILALGACKKDSNNSNNNGGGTTQTQELKSHTWTSYKVLNNGTDVTSSVTPLFFTFNSNGSLTGTSLSGSASGTWSLSGNTLNLGNSGNWAIQSLTATNMHLYDSSGAIDVYFQ